jgi:uncharacterized membrane protein YcaP (DUF421 family)
MIVFETVFGVGRDLGIGQECARAALIFAYGLLLVRISGRRTFGKWSALDIVVSIILGSSLSRALTGGAPLGGTLAACTVLMLLHWLAAQAAARSPRLASLLEGRPVVIVRDGAVVERARLLHGVTSADLDEAMRQSNADDARLAATLILEPSGKLSVQRKR